VRFFVDENLSPILALPLNALFRSHEFRTSLDEGLVGALDIPLFAELQPRGFGAIITKDSNQVVRKDLERRALYDNKIHWVGVAEPAAKGLHLIATWTANITAALPHVLAAAHDATLTPSWFSIKGVGVEARQRMSSGPLWRTGWGLRPVP
jgi:hypothetical protein